jgi:hypothetical protein
MLVFGSIAALIGIALIVFRGPLSRFLADRVANTDTPLPKYSAKRSTPGLFVFFGCGALFISAIVFIVAIAKATSS